MARLNGRRPHPRPARGGLLNDIPADVADNLEVGHRMGVELDEDVVLEVGLTDVTLEHGARTLLLDDEVVTMLLHALVTRDLMIRAGKRVKPCTDHDHGHDHH